MITVQRILGQPPASVSQLANQFLDMNPQLSAPEEQAVSTLVQEPGWILREFDFTRKKAIFFDIGDADVINVPFSYIAQQRHAKRLALVEFADFLDLASKLPRKHRIVQFYNIGHCGSTLLHNVFNESGEAWDISEPRLTWDVPMARNAVPRRQLLALAAASLTFLSRYPRAGERSTLVVKHVSQCTKAYDLWQETWPDAKNIYMYRDGISWCNSLYGFVQRVGLRDPIPVEMRHFSWMMTSGGEPESFLDGIIDLNAEPFKFWELASCSWGLHMQEILAAHSAGLNAYAFRYNELMGNREGVLQEIFAHCGLNTDAVGKGLHAFAHDAHEGEETAHVMPVENLTDAAKARVREILQNSRFNLNPEMIL